jgi:hypothetical protein
VHRSRRPCRGLGAFTPNNKMISPTTHRLDVNGPMVRTIRPGNSWRGSSGLGPAGSCPVPLGLGLVAGRAPAAPVEVGAAGAVLEVVTHLGQSRSSAGPQLAVLRVVGTPAGRAAVARLVRRALPRGPVPHPVKPARKARVASPGEGRRSGPTTGVEQEPPSSATPASHDGRVMSRRSDRRRVILLDPLGVNHVGL